VAAGTIVRKDELRTGRLLFGGTEKGGNLPYKPGRYTNQKRVVVNNIVYIANLMALNQWYQHVRSLFISKDFPEALLTGLKEKLNRAISERMTRLEALGNKIQSSAPAQKNNKNIQSSAASAQKLELYQRGSDLKGLFERLKSEKGDVGHRNSLLEIVHTGIEEAGLDYLSVIQGLAPSDAAIGTQWLQGIVDRVVAETLNLIPSYK
jgi:UDP-N-acetylglucosamine/UDP-N-acetylgalactosamine diphosphorylase